MLDSGIKQEKTKMRFKVGDKVRVREDLVVGDQYEEEVLFTREMARFCGMEFKVQSAFQLYGTEDKSSYFLSGGDGWTFTDDMLEPAEDVVCVMDKTVYIAGPMTGIKNHNRDQFNAAETKLKNEYANVYNPAHLPDNLTNIDYENIENIVLKKCDAIYLLKGWNKSVGARRELYAFMSMHKDGDIILEGE